MFGIGFQEMLIILVVILIFFGPKRLPDLAKSIGKGIAEFKKASDEVRKGIDDAMKEETVKEEPSNTETTRTETPRTEPTATQPTLPYIDQPRRFDGAKGHEPPSSQSQG